MPASAAGTRSLVDRSSREPRVVRKERHQPPPSPGQGHRLGRPAEKGHPTPCLLPFLAGSAWEGAHGQATRRRGTETSRSGVKLHKLRHTFGAQHAMAGTPANTIREFTGHKDIQTTMRYLHLSPAHKAEAASGLQNWRSRIGALWSQAPGHHRQRTYAEKTPPNLTLGGALMVTPTGLEPMSST